MDEETRYLLRKGGVVGVGKVIRIIPRIMEKVKFYLKRTKGGVTNCQIDLISRKGLSKVPSRTEEGIVSRHLFEVGVGWR